jgi:hypothetical protein
MPTDPDEEPSPAPPIQPGIMTQDLGEDEADGLLELVVCTGAWVPVRAPRTNWAVWRKREWKRSLVGHVRLAWEAPAGELRLLVHA